MLLDLNEILQHIWTFAFPVEPKLAGGLGKRKLESADYEEPPRKRLRVKTSPSAAQEPTIAARGKYRVQRMVAKDIDRLAQLHDQFAEDHRQLFTAGERQLMDMDDEDDFKLHLGVPCGKLRKACLLKWTKGEKILGVGGQAMEFWWRKSAFLVKRVVWPASIA